MYNVANAKCKKSFAVCINPCLGIPLIYFFFWVLEGFWNLSNPQEGAASRNMTGQASQFHDYACAKAYDILSRSISLFSLRLM